MNSLSKKCSPLAVSATMNRDGPAPMLEYAEPLRPGVDETAATAEAFESTSKSTHENHARPVPSTVTAGSLAASYVCPIGERCWKNGGRPSPQVMPELSE